MTSKTAKLLEEQDLEHALEILDSASKLSEQKEAVIRELNRNALKEELGKAMLEYAISIGATYSEDGMNAAIEEYISRRHSFKEPKNDFPYFIAKAYADRNRIGRVYGTPALNITATAIILWGAFTAAGWAKNAIDEGNVENSYITACQSLIISQNGLKTLSAASLEPNLQKELEVLVERAAARINGIGNFGIDFCSPDVKEKITGDNYDGKKKELSPVLDILNAVTADISRGEELVRISTGVRAYSQEIEQVYSSIGDIARESAALQQADSLYKEGKMHIGSSDILQLKQAVDKIKNLDAVLRQEYTIRVVNREGVKSGIDRYYTDKSGKRVSGYYLIVEARDSGGKVVQLPIRNEENGRTEVVKMWGERVPEAVYESVKRDKLDNGRIDNDSVGRKEIGFLDYKTTMAGVERQGQITRW